MTKEEYARHFAKVSDRVLVDLIDQPNEVDPVAMDVAVAELAKRELPPSLIAELRADRTKKEELGSARKARLGSMVEQVDQATKEIRQTFIEVGEGSRSEKRQHWLMLIAMGIILFAILDRFAELPWLLEGDFDISAVDYFLPLLLVPLTLYLLWRRKKWGWFFGAGITLYVLAQSLFSAYVNWSYEPTGQFVLDDLFPVPSHEKMLLGLMFAASMAALFQMPRSMVIYTVTERSRWILIAVVLALVTWMWFPLL